MKPVFINKVIEDIFSNSFIFDKFRNVIHNNFNEEKNSILKYFKKDKLTLDFGCGVGQFSTIFNPNKYYGVDTDKKYINFCKKNRKGNFLLIKEMPNYKFTKNYFDQILISAVIHHIDNNNLINIFNELHRILSNNGIVMIVDHFRKKSQKNLFCKILIDLDRGKHFRNPDDLVKLFSNKFKVKKIDIFRNGPYKDYALIFIKK